MFFFIFTQMTQVKWLCWYVSKVRTQRTISIRTLRNIRTALRPMVSFRKEKQRINVFRWELDRSKQTSTTDRPKVLLAEDHNDRLWSDELCGGLWPVQGFIKFIDICHFENLIVGRAEKNVFCSLHRSVQGTIMFSQLLGSTPPSQPSGTPCGFTMGWSSAPSKSNFDTIWKSSEWN